jgi:hypothetical protein
MATRHTITNADKIYRGDAWYSKYAPDQRRGVEMSQIYVHNFGAVDILDVNGIAEAQAVAGAGNLTLDGALVSGGVATMDVPRGVEIDSSDAGDTTQTAIFTGTDVYGETVTEKLTFNGTTAVPGKKAFKTVTQVAISAALTGNATAGTTDVLGLPFRIDLTGAVHGYEDGVQAAVTPVVADTTDPATNATGDVRGTVNFATASDGSIIFTLWMFIENVNTKVAAFGIDQV